MSVDRAMRVAAKILEDVNARNREAQPNWDGSEVAKIIRAEFAAPDPGQEATAAANKICDLAKHFGGGSDREFAAMISECFRGVLAKARAMDALEFVASHDDCSAVRVAVYEDGSADLLAMNMNDSYRGHGEGSTLPAAIMALAAKLGARRG